jgi:hypothetical protein
MYIYICIINTIPYQADPRPSKGLGAAPWHALAFAQRHVGSISRSTSQKGGEGRQKKCLEHGTNRYSVPPKMALCYFNRDIIYVCIYIYHDFFGKMMIALICVIRDNYGELWRMKKEPSNFGVPKTLHAPTVNRLVSWLLSGGIYTALFLLEKSSHFVIASSFITSS